MPRPSYKKLYEDVQTELKIEKAITEDLVSTLKKIRNVNLIALSALLVLMIALFLK